jgi:hypothetical protein
LAGEIVRDHGWALIVEKSLERFLLNNREGLIVEDHPFANV